MEKENLKELKLIIENKEKLGLNKKDFLKDSNNDIKFLKTVLENRKKYNLDRLDIIQIAMEINDTVYIKELIENRKKYINDEDEKIAIAFLIINMNDETYSKSVIENREKYGLESKELSYIAGALNDKNYIKKIIENKEKYGIESCDIIYVIEELRDNYFTKKVIQNYKKYKIDSSDVVKLISSLYDYDYIKKIIVEYKKYELNNSNIAYLLYRIPEEKRIEFLKISDKESIRLYRQQYASSKFIKKYIDEFIKLEENNIDKDILLKMSEKNEDVLKTDFKILAKKYIDLLGIDIVNQIACYQDIINNVVSLNDNELKLLSKLLNLYISKTKNYEWTNLANILIDNLESYEELIENLNKIENINIGRLIPILIHKNTFNIRSIEDIENFQKIKRKKCEELINSQNIKEKQESILLKIYGQNIQEAEKFGEDIDKIQDEELKKYIKNLIKIIEINNSDELNKLYEQIKEEKIVNPLLIEKRLKIEYWKLYNNDLFKIKDAIKLQDEENLYSAGTNFKMIITSVAPFVYNEIENYKKDWNRPSIGSQHFCASYIRNDMLGHAIIPHVCYGFEQMSLDSLVLSGTNDIFSSGFSFETTSKREEKYLAPDSQIQQTQRYNEMDFRRIQSENKKQPDYIVVFKKNGKIKNMRKAKKASYDFENLPIVVIDVDECLRTEKEKIKKLYEEYKKTGSEEIKLELSEKIRNNRVTDPEFYKDIV